MKQILISDNLVKRLLEIEEELVLLIALSHSDEEQAHNKADRLLIEALEIYGLTAITRAFKKVNKYYA